MFGIMSIADKIEKITQMIDKSKLSIYREVVSRGFTYDNYNG